MSGIRLGPPGELAVSQIRELGVSQIRGSFWGSL